MSGEADSLAKREESTQARPIVARVCRTADYDCFCVSFLWIDTLQIRHTDRSVRATVNHLVSDVGGEEVEQYSEQRQARNYICRKHPCTTAFVVGFMSWRLGRRDGRTTRSPMFHANLLGLRKHRGALLERHVYGVKAEKRSNGRDITTGTKPL